MVGYFGLDRSASARDRPTWDGHRTSSPAYGEAAKPAEIDAAADAFLVLRQYGFKDGEVRPVLAEVRAAGAGKVGERIVPYGYERPTWDGCGNWVRITHQSSFHQV